MKFAPRYLHRDVIETIQPDLSPIIQAREKLAKLQQLPAEGEYLLEMSSMRISARDECE
jgi:hypothetical protein